MRLTHSIALLLLTLSGCQDREVPTRPLDSAARIPSDPSLLRVPPTGTYTQVAAGASSVCALRTDGVVDCWGNNFYGQAPPTKTATTGSFTALAGFSSHACALRSDGVVECWGYDNEGSSPATVTPPSGKWFVAVGAGGTHACAVRNDGVIQCWGNNVAGQAPPEKTAQSGSFTAVTGGGAHTCGLRADGVIECWGADEYKQAPPTMTATNGSYTKVFTGQISSCGIRTDGIVECWSCELVNDNTECGPHQSLEGTFVSLGLNLQHSCAVRTDGVVECSGENGDGQAPATRTAASGSFTQVTVGADHSCALRSDGHIECWGNPSHVAFSTVLPTATFTAPASVIVGQPITLSLSNAQVPGYPSATTFTYAFDCGAGFDGLSYPQPTASCSTTTAGTRLVQGRVIDQSGDAATYSATVTIKSAQQGTSDLSALVSAAPLAPDIRKALLSKLNSALTAIDKGKPKTACSALSDFINQVNAQRGKAISTATADAWILTARQLQTAIGC